MAQLACFPSDGAWHVSESNRGTPMSERAATVAVVLVGTGLLAALRWGTWPFRRSSNEKRHEGETSDGSAVPAGRCRRRQLRALTCVVVALCLTWAVAGSLWISYTDAESRSLLLHAIARFTAVLVSAGILATPPLRKGDGRVGYHVALVGMLGVGWFAGSILLPPICDALAGPCKEIGTVVFAVPGWSFVPVAALLLGSVGARLGIASWQMRE